MASNTTDPVIETVVAYCHDCDFIGIREMHEGHEIILMSLTQPLAEKLDEAKEKGRKYFEQKQSRRNRGPFTGSYAVQE